MSNRPEKNALQHLRCPHLTRQKMIREQIQLLDQQPVLLLRWPGRLGSPSSRFQAFGCRRSYVTNVCASLQGARRSDTSFALPKVEWGAKLHSSVRKNNTARHISTSAREHHQPFHTPYF